MTSAAYREPGLSRDARKLWAVTIMQPPVPPPSAQRCGKCGYRQDAPGHLVTCGKETSW